ncbi:MAG: PAS domain S-box protein [Bacteroidales bacterium]|nr:PAS domain S-box protein [Bacteroidales bacterium]
MHFSGIVELLNNAALLLALGLIYDTLGFWPRAKKHPKLIGILTGAFLGLVGIALMMNSWDFGDGVIFDTRSVILCISGLFFGGIPTVVAMVITSIYRLSLGGGGALAGICVIYTSGAIGLGWRHFRSKGQKNPSISELLLFGIVVHLVMLACMLLMPWQTAVRIISTVTLPVLTIYPAATVVLGKLLANISKRRLLENETRKNEQKWRAYIESAPLGVFITNRKGEYLEVNPAASEITGYSREELLNMSIPDLLPRDNLESGVSHFQQLLEKGSSVGEMSFIKKNGDTRNWIVSAVRLSDDRFLGYVEDITERKLAEEKFQHSYDLMHYIIEHANSAIAVHDRNLKYLFVSQRYLDEYGVKEKDIIGKHHYEVFPDLPQKWRDVHQKALAGEVSRADCDPYYRDDGSVEWTAWECRPWHDNDGSIGGLIVFTRVITEQVLAANALRESLEANRAIIEASPLAIYSLTPEGHVKTWNLAAERIFGWKEDEVLDRILPIVQEDQKDHFHSLCKSVINGETFSQLEITRQRKDGSQIEISLSESPIFNSNKQPVGIIAIAEDITERKKAEREKERLNEDLIQSQKLESVGRLAGGVAHDFNNMLSVILGYAELAEQNLESEENVRLSLKEIRNAAKKSADITRQLLGFSRKQTISPEVLDLNRMVESVLKMLRRLLGEDIDLAWFPGASIWPIKMDPSQIDQILVNLCVNARDAIDDVGKITIETGVRSFDEAYCNDHADFVPGEFVMLSVSDDGCGMSKEVMQHLFEPFFTTKEMGKGSGLGLATVYGIVKQNNGFINIYSEPGQGTAVRIYFRRTDAPIESIQEDSETNVDSGGTETVLLVEDEEKILRLTKTMLERYGYAVVAFTDAEEAVRFAREHPGTIQILITDVVMPKMNGRQLAREIQNVYPSIKVLYVSGYTANVIAHRGVLDKDVHFLQKPFSQGKLAAKVREVIDE